MQQLDHPLLKHLNDQQKAAALHTEGPLVVFAGAGSGKTRIIVTRMALLIDSGVKPWHILAVTFTNKAAGEMRARLQSLNEHGSRCMVSTFHAACARWLREFAPELGFSSDFTIYDDADTKSTIKNILKQLTVPLGDLSPDDFKRAIAHAKTKGILPSEAGQLQSLQPGIFPPYGVEIYKRYQEALAAANAMDFGDLMMNMLLLLRRNERVREQLSLRFRYVLVDEYQDTNPAQFELISYLVSAHNNLFVVGDDDQSIYSWRGANPAQILEFEQLFPGATSVQLSQNYRCTKNIVDAASAMIKHNTQRKHEKTLWTDNEAGDDIGFHIEADADMEALAVTDMIERERDRFALHDVAVFYRTNSQSRALEEALRRENIPYRIFGSLRFYDRLEIKDMMSYLRLLVNEDDDVSFRRVINVPARGIGDKAVASLQQRASQGQVSLMAAARAVVGEGVPRLSGKLASFLNMFDDLKSQLRAGALLECFEAMLDAVGYKAHLDKKFPDQAADKWNNVHELGTSLAEYQEIQPEGTLSQWLQSVTLLTSEETTEVGGVSLMTLHMAKGLEFPRVYMVGMEDGLLPHKNSLDNPSSLEEERRLCYVGMTRARVKLDLLCARARRNFREVSMHPPSRFIAEIPEHLICPSASGESWQNPGLRRSSPGLDLPWDHDGPAYTSRASTPEAAGAADDEYVYSSELEGEGEQSGVDFVGRTAFHLTYGKGQVEKVEKEYGQWKAVVDFRDFGRRKVPMRHLEVEGGL